MTEKRIMWKDQIWDFEKRSYATNEEGLPLGYLEYERVGRFMHWCWNQEDNIRMSPGCLQEVRDKQKELLHKIQKRRKGIEN